MTLKIDNAIEEIERALAGNKPKYANDIYLKNAIRYLQEIKSPSLTDDQQVVLNYLIKQAKRCSDIGYLVGDLNFFASTEDGKAWAGLTEKERYQVLAAFAEWGMKEVAE